MSARPFFPPFNFSPETLHSLKNHRDDVASALERMDAATSALEGLTRRRDELTSQVERLEVSSDDARDVATKLAPLREELALVERRIEQAEQGNAVDGLRDALRYCGEDFSAAMSGWFSKCEAHWAELLAPFWHGDAKAALVHLQGKGGGRQFDMRSSLYLYAFTFPRGWGGGGHDQLRRNADLAGRFVGAILEDRQPFEFLLTARTLQVNE